MPKPYDRTTYDGKTVDWLTRAALEQVAQRLGYRDGLTLTQGSYNAGGVVASAGTHDGGGVVDLIATNHVDKVRELRRGGFFAWYRPAIAGLWPAHIHAGLIGNAKLSAGAKAQVLEYLNGYDGLAGDGRDTGPRQFINNRFKWRTGGKRISRAGALIEKARLLLATGIRGHDVHESRAALREAAKQLPHTD